MLSIHTLSHDAESYLMSQDTFAWSGALQAQLREERTRVILPFLAVVLCFCSLCIAFFFLYLFISLSAVITPASPFFPSPSLSVYGSLPLSLLLCSLWIPSGPTAGDYYTHRRICSPPISLCPLPPNSPPLCLFLSLSLSLFLSPFIHFLHQRECVYLCSHAQVFQPSFPLSSSSPPFLTLSPFLQSI